MTEDTNRDEQLHLPGTSECADSFKIINLRMIVLFNVESNNVLSHVGYVSQQCSVVNPG